MTSLVEYKSGQSGKLVALIAITTAMLVVLLFIWRDDSNSSYAVSHSTYLDVTGSLSFLEVCCGAKRVNFSEGSGSTFKTGGGNEVLWLKVSPPDVPGYLIIHSPIDHIALIRHDGQGNVTSESISGDLEPVTLREVRSSFFAFSLADDDIDQPAYLRMKNNRSYGASLSFIALPMFESFRERTELLHLVAIAIVLFMIAYNLMLSAFIRDAAFLLNAMFAAGLLTLNLAVTGIGSAYVWTGYENWSNEIAIHASSFNVIVICLFTFVFLTDTPLRRPYTKIFQAIIYAAIAGILLRYLGQEQLSRIVSLLSLMTAMITISVVSVVGTWRGDPRARVFLIAEGTVLLPGTVLFLLQFTFGQQLMVPPHHIIDVVMLLEALFFSLALAYRLRIAQSEASEALQLATRTQKEASARVLQGIDADRKRIASDLHDTAGQGLLVVSNQLSALSKDNEVPRKSRSELSEIAGYSKHIIGDIRRISHDLHPSIIEHLGWKQALQSLFTTIEELGNIKCDFEIDDACLLLNLDMQLQVYRILQEATNNIARHSKATKCKARIMRRGGEMLIDISDNGVGFSHKASQNQSGTSLGLEVMRQRVENLEGRFELISNRSGDSVDSHGTNIRISIPWDNHFAEVQAK